MHILVFGIPLREGMAGSVRVRNLLNPLVSSSSVTINNLYFALQADGLSDTGRSDELKIDLNFKRAFSILSYLYKSISFITKCYVKGEKNVFYLYETPDIKTIVPLVFAKLIGYKVVLDIVEDNSQAASFGGRINRFRIQSGAYILKNFQFLVDLNIVISSHLEKLLLQYTQPNKVVFIPVTMDISKFNTDDIPKEEVGTLFYGGSFGKKDGLPLLLEAFEEVCEGHPALQLVLTGKGENVEDFNEFMSLAQKSRFSDRISYKGFVPSADYQDLLNSCEIFCVIRDNSGAANTGFPSKLAEYLATGKAVIVTNVGDVASYLVDKENALLVPPEDLGALVSAIRYLINNPEQVNVIGSKGRAVAIDRFNSRIESQKLVNALHGIS